MMKPYTLSKNYVGDQRHHFYDDQFKNSEKSGMSGKNKDMWINVDVSK